MNIPQFISTRKACRVTFEGFDGFFQPAGLDWFILENPPYAGLFWDKIPKIKRINPQSDEWDWVRAEKCVAYIKMLCWSWSTLINCWLVVKHIPNRTNPTSITHTHTIDRRSLWQAKAWYFYLWSKSKLGGDFRYLFSPLLGEMIPIEYFFKWVETTN